MENQLLSKYGLTVKDVLNIIRPAKNDIVYMGGSIAEGFGNEGSDLDIYVVTEFNDGYQDKSVPFKELADGKEYTFMGHAILISSFYIRKTILIKKIEEIDEKVKKKQIMNLSSKSIEFYHRILRGIPLFNHSGFHDIKKELDSEIFIKNLSLNRLVYSENRHNDAIGALNSGDYWTAYISSKICLEKSLDALLIAKGDTNPSDKWLFRRLFSFFTEEEEWVQEFLNCYVKSKEDLRENTDKMLRLASRIRIMVYEEYESINNTLVK